MSLFPALAPVRYTAPVPAPAAYPPKISPSGTLIFITGGARSGKSRYAEARALSTRQDVTYLATAQAFDEEMADRIGRHRADRPAKWRTVEEPLEVVQVLTQLQTPVVLLDCLSLWVSNMMLAGWSEDRVLEAAQQLVAAAQAHAGVTICVTNEVGFGIVPDNALARRYRDLLGWVNQAVATNSDEAYLLVSGLALTLRPAFTGG